MKKYSCLLFVMLAAIVTAQAQTQKQNQSTSATQNAQQAQRQPNDIPPPALRDFEAKAIDEMSARGKLNTLYELLYRMYATNDPAAQRSTIMSKKLAAEKPNKSRIEGWATTLALHGYTIEKLQELAGQGINIIEMMETRDNDLSVRYNSAVLFDELIIVGWIDSVYSDESYADSYVTSARVTVLETLKGDSTIKKVVLRSWMAVNDGEHASTNIGHVELIPEAKQKAVFFLNRGGYKWVLLHPYTSLAGYKPQYISGDKRLDSLRKSCYLASKQTMPLGKNNEYLRLFRTDIEKLRELCKKYVPLLPRVQTEK